LLLATATKIKMTTNEATATCDGVLIQEIGRALGASATRRAILRKARR